MKICPSCKGSDLKVSHAAQYYVVCNNGSCLIGPSAITEKAAVEAWDALPREPQPVDDAVLCFEVDGVMYQVKFHNHGPVTFCTIVYEDKGRTFVRGGSTICAPKDPYNRAAGEKIAMRRACQVGKDCYIRFDAGEKLYSLYRAHLRGIVYGTQGPATELDPRD